MITASQLRAGMAIRYEGQNYKVIQSEYHPGQGKMGGVAHVRLQNLSTRTFWEHSFRADMKLENIPVEKMSMQYLYSDADQSCFMNPETYEQINIDNGVIGPAHRFLLPEMQLPVEFIEGVPISVLFPDTIEMGIGETSPPAHGQQDNTWKSAVLDNGVEVLVPQFIKTGDVIRLDVNSLRYVDRVKVAPR